MYDTETGALPAAEACRACALSCAASKKTWTLAVLLSLSTLLGCVLWGMLAVDRPSVWLLLPGGLLLVSGALCCAGLWLLSAQGREGALGAAGFRLARTLPLTLGLALQVAVLLALTLAAALLFFQPLLSRLLYELDWTWMSELFHDLTGRGEPFPTVVTALWVVEFLVISVLAELYALWALLSAGRLRALRRMALDGRPMRGGGAAEVLGCVFGVVIMAGGVWLLIVFFLFTAAGGFSARALPALCEALGLFIWLALSGLCQFYASLTLGAFRRAAAGIARK